MMFKWEIGRQESIYYKMKIFESKYLKMDMYILKYIVGSYLPVHKDPSPEGYSHNRLNIVLKTPDCGGYFYKEGEFFSNKKRIHKLISSRENHGMTPIVKGSRYVLSFGWLSKEKI
jgi:hypothetical protein